jgi:hypothetical protein
MFINSLLDDRPTYVRCSVDSRIYRGGKPSHDTIVTSDLYIRPAHKACVRAENPREKVNKPSRLHGVHRIDDHEREPLLITTLSGTRENISPDTLHISQSDFPTKIRFEVRAMTF